MILNGININMCGLDSHVIGLYQDTDLCKKMIQDLLNGDEMPPIKLYKKPNKLGEYTIADGIHRLCSYLYLERYDFKYIFI